MNILQLPTKTDIISFAVKHRNIQGDKYTIALAFFRSALDRLSFLAALPDCVYAVDQPCAAWSFLKT